MLDKVGGDMVRPRLHVRPPEKAEALDNNFGIFIGQGRPLVITVAAVVVTRNRPALLKRCLDALDSQTYPASQLVVIDNASDQPTRDLLALEAAHRDSSFHSIRLGREHRRRRRLSCRNARLPFSSLQPRVADGR